MWTNFYFPRGSLVIVYHFHFFSKGHRILCEECNIKLEQECCIYIILVNLGSAYSMFVSTFYATREALGTAYKNPSLESFFDALIREQDNIVKLGMVSTIGISNKALVAQ
jgi:hypothetical protein